MPLSRLLICSLALTAFAATAKAAEPVEFVRDVVPALTKIGCNAGSCHGAFPGRGGFALSLLGYDPFVDYDTIVKASRGRRVDAPTPTNSLLMRKASGAMPHGGGRKLQPGTAAYKIVLDYIRSGMPAPNREGYRITGLTAAPTSLVVKPGEKLPLRITAHWSDGVNRDVTDWALYDARDPQVCTVSPRGEVEVLKPGHTAVSVRYMGQVASVAIAVPQTQPAAPTEFAAKNYIDELARAEWKRLGVAPAALSTDAEFARRVYLDLIGTLPTPEEVRKFLASAYADKRAKLIDELLERPEYTDYWTMKWSDLLRVHRRYVGDKGLGSFGGWVRQSVRQNKPLDKMARELLTAQGNLFANGPVAYFFVDQKPDELAETTAQLFLGIRLQCARCHHHPFESWGQDDYWGLAAFFTKLEIRTNNEQGKFGGLQALRVTPTPPEARRLPVDAKLRTPGGAPLTVPDGDPRPMLADWITAKENPYFARNFANRLWAQLTGRGLVEPVDDMRATNPATNPALLEALAKDFAGHSFDAKHLIRTICNSRVYQLAAEVAPTRDQDGGLFTHRKPRRMPAEVLLDAINQATGFNESFVGAPPGTRAIALPDPTIVSSFLTTFGRPLRNNPCECARDSGPDLLQALHLLNNGALHAKIIDVKGRVASLLAGKASEAQIVEELYMATYSRKPTESELKAVRELLAESPSRKEGIEDLMWTLLNSPEFSFNH